MRAASRALRGRADPVPWPFRSVEIRAFPGFLVEGLGAPGAGKSTVGLTWALYLARRGMPALVHSTDTDLRSQALRVVAMMTGITTEEAAVDAEEWADWLERQMLPLRWSEVSLGAEDVGDLIMAEQEFFGEIPALVVIDTVGDLLHEEENVGNIRGIFAELHRTAKATKTTILALHHVKRGKAADGYTRVALHDGLYAGEQSAEIVFGIWREGRNRMKINVPKNRMGADDTVGGELDVDWSRATITDKEELVHA